VFGSSTTPRWYLIPVRILLVTFLFTLLSFALALLCGISGILLRSWLRGVHPNMSFAYSHVAAPIAATASLVTFISMTILEVRNYHQSRVLAAVARASRLQRSA